MIHVDMIHVDMIHVDMIHVDMIHVDMIHVDMIHESYLHFSYHKIYHEKNAFPLLRKDIFYINCLCYNKNYSALFLFKFAKPRSFCKASTSPITRSIRS